MRLLRFKRRLEEKGEHLMGMSLQDTLEILLSVGLHKQAEQLYKDFRVPDKRCGQRANHWYYTAFTCAH